MRLLLIFLIALSSIQCSKEPLYEPVEKQYFDFELQTSHYYQIRRGTFQVRLIEVISDGVSISSVIQKLTIPFLQTSFHLRVPSRLPKRFGIH